MSDTVTPEQAGLRKELGLGDLVMAQVLCVVGSTWVGIAAKLGRSHVAFWLGAMLLFYVPLAVVVIYLNRMMPLEGGLYQWAKSGLGEMAGFLTAWNLWVYAVIVTGAIIFVIPTDLGYILGAPGAWIPASKLATLVLTGGVMAGITLVAIRGLDIGKWLHNVGSIGVMAAYVILLGLPLWALLRGTITHYEPIPWQLPPLSWFGLAIFGQMTVGALSGFEYVAVLAGETKNPERTIGRATIIAAPIIAAMFILGTSAVLAFVPIDKINLIGPIPQVLSLGFGATGAGTIAAAIAILLITGRTIANSSIVFTATTRMPMVAGWDDLLPRWFTTLHPRYRTPINSILFVGLVALAFGAVGIAGVGEQEAFQLLENAAGIFYGLTYLVMFVIPIVGMRHANPKPSLWLRIASISGFAVTALYVVLSIFPIIDVTSWLSFAAKISGVVIGLNLAGLFLYLLAHRRRAAVVAATGLLICFIGGKANAQVPVDTTKCDSIVFASAVDSVPVGFFISAARIDGSIESEQAEGIAIAVASAFTPPRPFRVSVFSGPAQMSAFKRISNDVVVERRAPTVTGVYRFWSLRRSALAKPQTVRASLVPGFDSAAFDAIASAVMLREAVMPASGEDSMLVEIRFSTDSTRSAKRMISAIFPVMPVMDAAPKQGNLRASFPDAEKADTSLHGEIVVRFVVGRDGTPMGETLELMRGTSMAFLRAALEVLPEHRFTPARVNGCAVAQAVVYPFSFVQSPQKMSPRY